MTTSASRCLEQLPLTRDLRLVTCLDVVEHTPDDRATLCGAAASDQPAGC